MHLCKRSLRKGFSLKWCISITFLSRKPIHAVWPTLYQQECISHFISIYFHQKGRCDDPFFITNRGSSSSGRAFGSQSKGSGFESHLLHKKRELRLAFFLPPISYLIPNCASFLLSPRLLLAFFSLQQQVLRKILAGSSRGNAAHEAPLQLNWPSGESAVQA